MTIDDFSSIVIFVNFRNWFNWSRSISYCFCYFGIYLSWFWTYTNFFWYFEISFLQRNRETELTKTKKQQSSNVKTKFLHKLKFISYNFINEFILPYRFYINMHSLIYHIVYYLFFQFSVMIFKFSLLVDRICIGRWRKIHAIYWFDNSKTLIYSMLFDWTQYPMENKIHNFFRIRMGK